MKSEKTMKDKRYQKKERAIREAFFRCGGEISGKDLATEAKVGRATLYRHHRGVHRVAPEVEEQTLEEYEEEVVIKGLKPGVRVRMLYLRTLNFIRARKMEFQGMIKQGDGQVLEEMVGELVPKISRAYRIPRDFTEGVRIYENEVTAVVEVWIEDDFSTSEMRVLNQIMWLTKTARKRLMALEK